MYPWEARSLDGLFVFMSNRFEDYLALVIEEEAQKLIDRYHAYHNFLHLEHKRNKERVLDAPDKEVKTPDYWRIDPKEGLINA